jgi:hypothetical protein
MNMTQKQNKITIYTIPQVFKCWLLTMEAWVQSLVISCKIGGGQSGTEAGFSPSFFCFTLLLIPPLLHTHLLLSPEVCSSPDQAAHYHIFGVEVCGFFSDSALGWLQSKEVKYLWFI